MRTVITVDQVRRTVSFFGSTAGEGGWRVCIVDTADELQYPEASNALLKMLEEPPARSLFLLVSHSPGRLLPTIRSRCRRLILAPLDAADVVAAATAALGPDADAASLATAAQAAGGSVARAIALAGGPLLALRQQVDAMLGGAAGHRSQRAPRPGRPARPRPQPARRLRRRGARLAQAPPRRAR